MEQRQPSPTPDLASKHAEDLQRLRNFRLLDDDFMSKVFEDTACTELLLQIILDRSDLKVQSVHSQHEIKNLQGRSIRLDILATNAAGQVCNIEIQRSDKGAGVKRARYNGSLMDANLTAPGDAYEDLAEVYVIFVIFITEHDVLGGGLPIGAVLFGEKAADVLTAGSHGSTFGGNPAVCAGAEVVVDRLTDEFLDAVAAKGERVRKALEGAAGISEITGMGLMIGVRTARPVADVLADLRSEGVLALKAHDKLRLLPPLNISDELLDEAVEKIKKVCAK